MARSIALFAALLVLGVVGKTFADDPEKIVGGSDASLGEVPHQVSLRTRNSHFCGGSLVSDRHVVTAGHCVDGIMYPPYNDITVVTGTINRISGGQSHRIRKVIVHSGFRNEVSISVPNDIAVLILQAPVQFNAYQKPVALATSDPPVNSPLFTSGWGMLRANGPLPVTLQKTTVYTMSHAECQAINGQTRIYDTHICTKSPRGVGVCQGDSGGPLLYNGQLVGVTSWVYPCALGYPDVYTRVPRFLVFLRNAMAQ